MKNKLIEAILKTIQWMVWLPLLVLAIYGAAMVSRARMEGAPIAAYGVGMTAILLILVIHFPPLFRRLRKWWKPLYATLAFGLAVHLATQIQLQIFFDQTPQGIALENRKARKEMSDSVTKRNRQILAEMESQSEAEERQVSVTNGNIDRCRLGLAATVRAGLHNPRSFDHVQTVTDPDSSEIRITYRAENGFGSVRTATTTAQVDPATCSILSLSNSTD